MNDILICNRSHGKALVLAETTAGKSWMRRNMILNGSDTCWIDNEGVEDVVALIKADDLYVEVI